MRRTILILLWLCLLCPASQAADLSAREIVQKKDDLMRGESSSGQYEMVVSSPRWERTVKFKAWSQGTKQSFIVINYPRKDAGTTFLRKNTDMWQYVPRIEKTIKIPPSMMLQSWMGSDFTNDDLAKESSIVDDYTHTLKEGNDQAYQVESVPKPDAAIVWGKVVQWIDKKTFVPLRDEFYDEDGVLIRKLLYEDVKQLSDRLYPMRWTVEPLTEEKKGHKTTIVISEIEFNAPMEEDVFTMRALKDYSR